MLLPQTADERLQRVSDNMRRFRRGSSGYLREPLPERDETLMVCGYGPSLARTWQDIMQVPDAKVMTTSGAHDFLISRGIVPDYHVECDPREHKCFFLKNPHPQTRYYIASHCHPKMFEMLRSHKVTMWHGFTDDDLHRQCANLYRLDRKAVLLSGGTNVGMRALIVGRHLGFRKFVVHGIDCSYDGETLWAGEHSGKRHNTVKVKVDGKVFDTSDIMMQATDDFFNQSKYLYGCSFVILGGGLLAARGELYKRDPELALSPKWWEPVGFERKDFSLEAVYPTP
jgi:hypothetical protein